ncbi:MAG TPA: hypothetical protein VK303_00390 [Desulfobacteria bacterium]|nr:hypothetical protein [Desulfobacteria bacterium]
MMKNRIVKALVIFFLYLSIYTYMCIGGVGMVLAFASPTAIMSMPA